MIKNSEKLTEARAIPKQFKHDNNKLLLGGLSLTNIELLLGSTPYYAYDKQIITEKVASLKAALPSDITLHYAIKANPYQPIVNLLAQQVSGFDVASKKEMLLALQTGMPANNISFAGPGKTIADISAAIIAGVTLHVESPTEISRVANTAQQLSLRANIAIRVNPEFELKHSGMKMSGGAKPFGIDEEALPELIPQLPFEHINLRGFHIYSGSQNLNADAILSTQQQTLSLATKLITLAQQYNPTKIDYINMGGGLGIPYFKNEKPLDIEYLGNQLTTVLKSFKSKFADVEVILELGRYLVGDAGIYVTKVIDKKVSRGTSYLVCDGGLHHHLANSGNFGQVIRKNYPVAIGNKLAGDEREQVSIVGPLCTPLDILADKVTLPTATIDDYVVVFQSGAYGASASPKDFLSQPELKEVLL
ncbi:pyridoxal-dependent decarboxylase, exosortase A system-associated [Colwellia sp. D2M02]|uniref:pyridoxal-dependent decarboxylase, exosortase A system-associated n=1 Tax=Colwellia sp. D2M02 TaxID=2841562 RepID=UPI001C0A4335|nr:pyridoxal-dependent decarboxylase, exosortase A system-associated [Colwellia sp. D2M02]MBU2893563.1 pyridoxal-dependent decarboxylase, exosortase A system-associated [Colwellia sp. D2M02]